MSDKTFKDKSKDKNKWEKFVNTDQSEVQDESKEEEAKVSSEASLEHSADFGIEFPDRKTLERKLTEMEQLVDEYKEKSLRIAAQMKNSQDRAERDIRNAHKYGAEKLLSDLLPVLDSLAQGIESANNHVDSNESMLKGMQLTLEMLVNTLKKHGVEVIHPACGDAFNPEVHEAMTMQEEPDAQPNTILQVLQRGYSLNGRVLRAARVIVAK